VTAAPLFPGGVAVSHLAVYDWEAADGMCGGSPHLHTASSEGYVVTGGSGAVHTISAAGSQIHPLVEGNVVWFSPGTIHRLVNGGDLRLVVVMQNSGLPEAGDAVLTFPTHVLDDADAYRRAATLPKVGDASIAEIAEAARTRRDLALEGYAELEEAIRTRGLDAWLELHARAARLVQPKVADWQRRWEETVAAETERTRSQLAALAAAEPGTLDEASVAHREPNEGERGFGMCGRLQTWDWPSS
jgi:mannose-6-phosphate isomerase-like protein (cupin superfamily)